MWQRWVVGGLFSVLALVLSGCWPMPQQIAVSPDGRFLALSMPLETQGLYEPLAERSQLWLVERATGEIVTAIRDGERISWVTWSPDGQELLYVASTGLRAVDELLLADEWRLMLYRLETGERRLLLADRESVPWGLSFSPDGQQIAYYRVTDEGKIDLVLLDRVGQESRVVQTIQEGGRLRYLPYGPRLLWLKDSDTPALVLVRVEELLPSEELPALEEATSVRVARGRIVRVQLDCLCEAEIARGYYPVLPVPLFIVASPDGRRLYFNGYSHSFALTPEEPIYLYEMDIEERQMFAIYDGDGIALAPAISPDGSQLLFTVIEHQKSDLYLRSFQALSPAAKITHDGRSGFGFWLTDEEIAFLRRVQADQPAGELWRKHLISGEEEALTPLLARQRRTAELSVQLAAAQQEAQQYRQELIQTQETLQELQNRIELLRQSLQELSAELQAQSQRTVEEIARQWIDPVQQINALRQAVSELRKQTEGIDAKLTELQKRPQLDLWTVALIVAIGALVVIVILRRSFRTIVQALAFPPQ
ncbi:MAG: hypothetical protein NZ610_05070 [Candidatus Bipolaricaulota bacterium]|nr:hypothetical protein [Candidatus Bipolaricaulota bacterium]MCS7274758.1 hypothetical protein [Candidatus Bipolaricaulota bacterium]MDW8110038.1 hypothetical protein [Candidatus Bipolaricaulota bacterium]MDW8329463.1 hypothetical protein [Candidatus Bipolaricaulota bacterium]